MPKFYNIFLTVGVIIMFPNSTWSTPSLTVGQKFLGTGISELGLRDLNVRKEGVTVSGFSSGGALASHLHVAHSHVFSGLGLFSAVFYRCSGDTMNKTLCFMERGNSVDKSISDALDYETKGLIDPLRNLADQKLFMWFGTRDEKLATMKTRLEVINFYQRFIPDPNNIMSKIQAAYHLLPTDRVNQSCTEETKMPDKFLGNCNYSGTYEMFQFLYGPFIQRASGIDDMNVAELRTFNQAVFFPPNISENPRMDEIGFAYIPRDCQSRGSKPCFLHMHLHGCTLARGLGGRGFIEKSGFLETAEKNRVIVIFPQAGVTPKNPQGCWDTDGQFDVNYANQEGNQIKTLKNILDSINFANDTALSKSSGPVPNSFWPPHQIFLLSSSIFMHPFIYHVFSVI